MPKKTAQQLIVNPIKQIHAICGRVLKADNITTIEWREEQERTQSLINSILKV
jgi:hypothetical protein